MKDLNHYKKVYNNTCSPASTHRAIIEGIETAEKKHRKKPVFLIAQGLAAVFVLLLLVINVFPAAAAVLSDVPVVGTLVKVFTINQPEIEGGEITDDDNVKDITAAPAGQNGELIITFSEYDAPHYTAVYSRSPFVLTVEVSGVRSFDAADSFEKIAGQDEHIEHIYPLITLDDSAVRFNIIFKQNIDYVISEYADPGRLIITYNISDEQPAGTVYSVRTPSMEQNELFAHMEEYFYDINTRRVLTDAQENRILELRLFDSEQEAQDFLNKMTADYGDEYELIIEEREAQDLPAFLTAPTE